MWHSIPSILWLSMPGHKKQCSANISFGFESNSWLLLGGLCAIVFLWNHWHLATQKVLLWNISCFLVSLNIERLNDWQTFWLRASHLRRLRVKAAQEQYWFSSAHQKLPFLIFIYFRHKSTNPAHNQSHNFANSLLFTWHWMHTIAKKVSFAYQSTGIKWGALSLEVFLQLSFLIEEDGRCFFWHFICQRHHVG